MSIKDLWGRTDERLAPVLSLWSWVDKPGADPINLWKPSISGRKKVNIHGILFPIIDLDIYWVGWGGGFI